MSTQGPSLLTRRSVPSFNGAEGLKIDCVFTSSSIGDVGLFKFKVDDSCDESAVQVLELHVGRVNVSTEVEDGATLLTDPHFVEQIATRS